MEIQEKDELKDIIHTLLVTGKNLQNTCENLEKKLDSTGLEYSDLETLRNEIDFVNDKIALCDDRLDPILINSENSI